MKRSAPILISIVIATLSACPAWCLAQASTIDPSIANGLSFLAKQQADDGSFSDEGLKPTPSALSVLAFLSAGETPDIGRYGLTLRRAISFLQTTSSNRNIPFSDAPLVCMALSEAYAVEPVPEQRLLLRNAVQELSRRLGADNPELELQQRVQIVLALRGARNIGIEIPQADFQQQLDLILACYNRSTHGFGNRPGAEPSTANLGAAWLVFQFFPPPQPLEEIALPDESLDSLLYPPLYLAVQRSLLQTSGSRIAMWETLCRRLLAEQSPDGGWNTALKSGGERILSTSYALLIQTARGRVLTIFLH